jgi:anti-sigma B factor antagonist
MKRTLGHKPEVLNCSESLDANEMVAMKSKMNRLIHKNQKRVVLDLSHTSSIDLAGLGILIERLRFLRSVDGDVKFCNVRPEVDYTLRLVGLNGLIETYSSRAEAVASF